MEPPLPTSEPGRASDVVAACETAWQAFQRHHPDLPDAIIVLGSGVERGRLVKLGHWWAARWEQAGTAQGEVLLAGEALHLPVEDVFDVLLHEAAHGLNCARGIKDTSRDGRYHNARYRATAEEVGLIVAQRAPNGWAHTRLGPTAAQRYQAEMTALRDAMRIARRVERPAKLTGTGTGHSGPGGGHSGGGGGRTAGSAGLACGCGRRLRMAPSVAAQGPVWCGACGTEFNPAINAAPTNTPPGGLAHLAGHAPDHRATPEHAAALAQLRRAALQPETLWAMARAGAWAQAHGALLDEALTAATPAEADQLNQLARAYRRLAGQLSGPDLDTGQLPLACGDQVTVRDTTPSTDTRGRPLPPAGVVGIVVAVDTARRTAVVDFPIAGRHHLSARTAGRALGYGYAATAHQLRAPHPAPGPATPAGAGPTPPGPQPAVPEAPLAQVIELGW